MVGKVCSILWLLNLQFQVNGSPGKVQTLLLLDSSCKALFKPLFF